MPYMEEQAAPMDFTKYFSVETVNRQRSALKVLRPYFEIPGMVSVSRCWGQC